jgi:hypothetical protein
MITYTNVKNPKWVNAEMTFIDCEVEFPHLGGFVPFTAVAQGDMEHTHQIFAECASGKYGEIAPYVAINEQPQPEVSGTETL